MTTNEPFQPEDVLYRFASTEEQRKSGDRIYGGADEYVILSDGRAWGWYCRTQQWLRVASSAGPVIARLLVDLAATTAERDVYQRTLERIAAGNIHTLGDIAREALWTGKKLRGEAER